ncbi:hypothetical protein CLV40_1481 [Actinokineospora auranticolor]|uniref:Uncharacterized protein n=2 Tax=Actinokineospora auranticolor TaxID=155976 RepID=A0A2S6GB39_9PSEU|nr:hypothetical protein CLV40_1481 [Actinokineospora auranticolor]
MLLENNGFTGARPETLRRLSVGGEALTAYWNVTAVSRVSHWRDGVELTTFEFGEFPDTRGVDQASLDRYRPGLDFVDDGRESALTMVGRAIGAEVTADWLARRRQAALLVSHEVFRLGDPDSLLAAYADIRPDAEFVQRAVRAACSDTGVLRHGLVARSLTLQQDDAVQYVLSLHARELARDAAVVGGRAEGMGMARAVAAAAARLGAMPVG